MNRYLRYLVVSLLLVVGGRLNLYGQFATGGTPLSLQQAERGEQLRSWGGGDTLSIEAPTKALLRTLAQREQRTSAELRPYSFAYPLEVQLSLSGMSWHKTSDGQQIGRMTLKAEGAKSLSMHCSRFVLPEGASLYLHGAGGLVRGAFTHQNVNDERTQSFAPLQGDWITLEVNLPAGISTASVQILIDKLYYGYRDLHAEGRRTIGEARLQEGEPLYDLNGRGLERMSCAPNVVAYPEHSEQARATLLLMAEGRYLSTGTLINNTRRDGTAYVLTAAHNLNRIYDEDFITETVNDPLTIAKVREVCKTMVFFFGFESPSKDQDIRGAEEKTLTGAKLIAYDEEHDMALIQITGLPTDAQGIERIPASYNPYWAGWNLSASPRPTFFGIHHALGTTKRICFAADQSLQIYDYSIGKQYDYLDRDIAWRQAHWRVTQWEIGTTEAGASGSPLFDGDGLVIGALTGGRSTCSSPYRDHYYALMKAFGEVSDGRADLFKLRPWLDPNASGVERLSGYDPYQAKPIQRISLYYGQPTKGNLTPYEKHNERSGLGRVIRLDKEAEALGVYVQLGLLSLAEARQATYQIELTPIEDGVVSSTPLWTTSLSNYLFTRYSSSRKAFERVGRTLGEEEVEVFVPSSTLSTLPQGDYLLSIRTADDQPMDYPLLGEQYRTTSPSYGRRLWTKTIGRGWEPASEGGKGLWLDLLVQGAAEAGTNEVLDSSQLAYTSYAHRDKLYVYSPKGEVEVRIYDLLGQVYREQTVPEGESTISVDGLLPNQIYIVHLKGALGSLSYKFRPTH